MAMKAAIYREFGARIAIEDLPDPEPAPDGVVLRIMATGVCRSDWHGWQGHDPDIQLPHVPGHELSGVIEAAGSDGTGLIVSTSDQTARDTPAENMEAFREELT